MIQCNFATLLIAYTFVSCVASVSYWTLTLFLPPRAQMTFINWKTIIRLPKWQDLRPSLAACQVAFLVAGWFISEPNRAAYRSITRCTEYGSWGMGIVIWPFGNQLCRQRLKAVISRKRQSIPPDGPSCLRHPPTPYLSSH